MIFQVYFVIINKMFINICYWPPPKMGMRLTEHFIVHFSQRLINDLCLYCCKDLAWYGWGQKRWQIVSLLILSPYKETKEMNNCAFIFGLKSWYCSRHDFDSWSLSACMWMPLSPNLPSQQFFRTSWKYIISLCENISICKRSATFAENYSRV